MPDTKLIVPDIGDFKDVEIIEVHIKAGDAVAVEDPLITLETDKAAMDIPASDAGTVKEVMVKVGGAINQGDEIAVIETAAATDKPAEKPAAAAADKTDDKAEAKTTAPQDQPQAAAAPQSMDPTPEPAAAPQAQAPQSMRPPPVAGVDEAAYQSAHASPAVRRFARELGADLGQVQGSGRKGRVTQEDVKAFVKQALGGGAGGLQVAPMPEVDFAAFGPVELLPLSKINKLTGRFLHRNWVTIPHVTQFDEANITELEKFRKTTAQEYKEQGVKLTLLAFLVKAVISALKKYPRFNGSLDSGGENLVMKRYFHIGIAVDTADGLVVPVIRDADKKSLIEIAREMGELSARARDKKLKSAELQGGCFSISSLGGIGGTAFTPIINAPEVAILGVSRSQMRPVWDGGGFTPQLMLPLSLSYDHRVIDGADGARFTTYLAGVLSDTRRLLL